MSSLVVVGIQWGDEGKGKLVDLFAAGAQWVVRFQGGDNAGHTIVVGDKTFKLRLSPCGVLHPHVRCVIGAGVVVNPHVLLGEIEMLRSNGIEVNPQRFIIDRDAHLVLPYHPLIDAARERVRGSNLIGTTGRGIGPAYEDRSARIGVRVADLTDLASLRGRIEANVEEKNRILASVFGSSDRVGVEDVWRVIEEASQSLVPYLGNGSLMLHEAIKRGERVIFEGAQAAMLDQTFGTVPYVTSSHTVAGAVTIGCGLGPRAVHAVLGVAKAYATRVGSGPFPTEIKSEVGDAIRERGREYGTVTGRPRRCGWFDAVTVRRAVRLNGCDALALMKLDVLAGMESVRICAGYELNGKLLDDVPATLGELERVVPRYIEVPGWHMPSREVRSWGDLPQTLVSFCEEISRLVDCPVVLASIGPDRSQTVLSDAPAARAFGNLI